MTTEIEDLKQKLAELDDQETIEDLKDKVKIKQRELKLRPIKKFIGIFKR